MTTATPASSVESKAMTLRELLELPAIVNVETAARAFGIGRNKAMDLIRAGQFPAKTLRLGATVKVPTASLREALGLPTVLR
ncbi:helix-turn-helix domain-containing protein [Kitasatospora sp. MBT63]|uniref:helix-turn-helix domain-containing protein n=1 Tax=Kitasatospora sp. MBT63 TaxID=1444768 RepID=UPI001E3552A0|nr:helix-turn-helix domain-containing protein [Kitasatospora sp. MBT63]